MEAHPDRIYFVVKREDDPELVAAFADRVAPDELLGWAPADLYPELAS